jgi:hypothetical protein
MGKAIMGTVSHGTMRNEDLIPAFVTALKDIDKDKAAEFENDLPEDRKLDWNSEDADDMLERLFDALNEQAPDGCYFGAHPGDGCDYGFWKFEDED